MTFLLKDEEILCLSCRQPIENGCFCDHNEWMCEHCGTWSHRYYYDRDVKRCAHCYTSPYRKGTNKDAAD